MLRDAEHHAPTRQIAALRRGPRMAAIADAVGAGLGDQERREATTAILGSTLAEVGAALVILSQTS